MPDFVSLLGYTCITIEIKVFFTATNPTGFIFINYKNTETKTIIYLVKKSDSSVMQKINMLLLRS